MNNQEAVVLTRLVAAACPQQAMDEYTPDAWCDLLGDLDFSECRDAVRAIGKRQPFISPAEIRTEVRHVREERIARLGIPAPPSELADDPVAYKAVLADSVRRAASGIEPGVSAPVKERAWEATWRGYLAEGAARTKRDRDMILKHPDLAARLTQEPLNYTRPSNWTGYIPPELWEGERNRSPEREALLAIWTEAMEREPQEAPW